PRSPPPAATARAPATGPRPRTLPAPAPAAGAAQDPPTTLSGTFGPPCSTLPSVLALLVLRLDLDDLPPGVEDHLEGLLLRRDQEHLVGDILALGHLLDLLVPGPGVLLLQRRPDDPGQLLVLDLLLHADDGAVGLERHVDVAALVLERHLVDG